MNDTEPGLYSKQYEIIWANLDPNMHLRHTSYNDYAAQTRLSYFIEKGLSLEEFQKAGIGPVLFREDTRFLKEVRISETILITCEIIGLRKDTSRWNIFHRIFKKDGVLAATIQVEGAWLDLKLRKLAVPSRAIAEKILGLTRSPEFQWIPDSSSKTF